MINAMKAFVKADRARTAFEAATEVLAETVCSVDLDGVVHGAKAIPTVHATKKAAAAKAECLKNLYRKRSQQRKIATEVLCVGENGKVFIFMYFPRPRSLRTFSKSPDTGA